MEVCYDYCGDECIYISDACLSAMILHRNPNGTYCVKGLSEVHGMGMGDYNKKYLNMDFEKVVPFCSFDYTAYVALKRKGEWGLIRIDGDYNALDGLVSEVCGPSFSSLKTMMDHFGLSHLQSRESNKIQKILDYENYRVANGVTPEKIMQLRKRDIFVFGSNLAGQHAGGAARTATKYFGARWGVGDGRTGQCYAIPTMQGGIDTIKPYVDKFIEYTRNHPELQFLVTPIGCGIAGFKEEEIAPLFKDVLHAPNVNLPSSFIKQLTRL